MNSWRLGPITFPSLNLDDRPRAVRVDFQGSNLVLTLQDGRVVSVPADYSARLANATNRQRQNWRLIARGTGIHWPDVDEDLSVEGIVRESYDLRRPALVEAFSEPTTLVRYLAVARPSQSQTTYRPRRRPAQRGDAVYARR